MELKWDFYEYTAYGLENKSESELRAEYSKLRSIARKRLERMGQSEFSDTAIYRYNKGRYIPLDEIKSKTQLKHKLSDVASFLMKETSSISGQKAYRKNVIKSLHESGFTWVNAENFNTFTDFMEYNRQLRQGGLMDSERVAETVKFAEKQKLDPEELKNNFQWWVDNIENAKTSAKKLDKDATASQIRNKVIAEKRKKSRGKNKK